MLQTPIGFPGPSTSNIENNGDDVLNKDGGKQRAQLRGPSHSSASLTKSLNTREMRELIEWELQRKRLLDNNINNGLLTKEQSEAFITDVADIKMDLQEFEQRLHQEYPMTDPENSDIIQDLRQLYTEHTYLLPSEACLLSQMYVGNPKEKAFLKVIHTGVFNGFVNKILDEDKERLLEEYPQFKCITRAETCVSFKLIAHAEITRANLIKNEPKIGELKAEMHWITPNAEQGELIEAILKILHIPKDEISENGRLELIRTVINRSGKSDLDKCDGGRIDYFGDTTDYSKEFMNKVEAMFKE